MATAVVLVDTWSGSVIVDGDWLPEGVELAVLAVSLPRGVTGDEEGVSWVAFSGKENETDLGALGLEGGEVRAGSVII